MVVTHYFCDTKETKRMQSAQMEIKLLRCEERVRVLEEVVKQQSDALKESSKLLQKSRPQRPAIPHDRKLAQASEQGWKCVDPYGVCPQWALSDGTFSVAGGLFEADHIEPYSISFRTSGNVNCLCASCHNMKCRKERLTALEDNGEGREEVE